jgi:serine/threonine protein kinase
MGSLSDWEKVMSEPLGRGGQSTVFLVRRPERRDTRNKSFETLRELAGGGLNNPQVAQRFASATIDMAREDYPSELGALKVFNPRAAGSAAEQQALGRLKNEINILSQDRPGLLKLLDHNESEKWIVTEYRDRGTLEQHLARYKGNVKLVIKSFLSLVRTVTALHQEGIVHRDIKPQNIFMGDDDELILGDFGIVFLPNQLERLSVSGESVGPHDFMPPWVFLDEKPEIKQNFDVYMMGKVLWCMVTGRMKLPREEFRDHRFDVTALYPNDPDMYIINRILEKCVVAREQECLFSALDLLPRILAYAEMLKRGGELVKEDIPRPCRVCGYGDYQKLNAGAALHLTKFVNMVDQHVGSLRTELLACDKCGHVQFFKIG